MKWNTPLALFVVGMIVGAVPAVPCSCGELSLDRAVAEYDVVLVGKVAKLEIIDTRNGVDSIRATVETTAVVKGQVGQVVEFLTDNGCCYCSFGFEIAEQYLLFGIERGGAYSTSVCSRSAKVAEAASDIKALGLEYLLGQP